MYQRLCRIDLCLLCRQAQVAGYFGPLEFSRKIASCVSRLLPRDANFGIGEPGFTHDGHFRWLTWNWMPRLRVPMFVRSGAPRFDEPVPRYVWQAVQPATAKSLAPGTALGGRFCALTQCGTSAITSEASASDAVAPFHVSTAIEITTSTAPTTATGRREIRRSRRMS